MKADCFAPGLTGLRRAITPARDEIREFVEEPGLCYRSRGDECEDSSWASPSSTSFRTPFAPGA